MKESSKKWGSMYERNIQKVGFHVWKKQPNHLNSPKDSQVLMGEPTFDFHCPLPAFEYCQIHPELADKASPWRPIHGSIMGPPINPREGVRNPAPPGMVKTL